MTFEDDIYLVSESAVNEAGVLLALAAEHAQARHHTTLHLVGKITLDKMAKKKMSVQVNVK